MSKMKLFFVVLAIGLSGIAFAEAAQKADSSKKAVLSEEETLQSGTFGEYLSQKEPPQPEKETSENELLAPVATPVATVIEGVGQAVEPFLEEKKIKDEKGETQANIKLKEGKVQVDFYMRFVHRTG